MTQSTAVLRDFVYLDWERVRSLAAQLFHGIPQDAATERGREVKVEGRVEGSIPGLLKGEAAADYRYFRTENETRSLHHYVYSLVEARLLKDQFVTPIGADFDF
jgi:hypothetical protein